MTNQHITLDDVEELAFEALRGAGTGNVSARALARAVRSAEEDGIPSHGLHYVPTYCEHVRCGKVDGQAIPEVVQKAEAAIVVDAGTGFAHPAIDAGFERLIPSAKKAGCATLTVQNSYNCGVLGYHVERLARSGLVGLGFTNAPASIAPLGGKRPVVGTNPIALGVPGAEGEAAFVIDQSASVVAKSEIMMHARRGEAIPEGWALDREGQPTTDPDSALQGSMAPSGGYKGFGVGMIVEVFAAALSGATLGINASPFSGTAGGPPRTGQCFIAFAPGAFSGDAFAERIDALAGAISAQEGCRLPGERRRQARERIRSTGVEVSEDLLARIRAFMP